MFITVNGKALMSALKVFCIVLAVGYILYFATGSHITLLR